MPAHPATTSATTAVIAQIFIFGSAFRDDAGYLSTGRAAAKAPSAGDLIVS
jgi:hypothetical protein